MSVSIKAKCGDAMRRFSVSNNTDYESLCKELTSYFPAAQTPLKLRYIDDDDDIIMLSSDSELSELFRVIDASKMSVVHIMVNEDQNSTNDDGNPRPRQSSRAQPAPASTGSNADGGDTNSNIRTEDAGASAGIAENRNPDGNDGTNRASAGRSGQPCNNYPFGVPPCGASTFEMPMFATPAFGVSPMQPVNEALAGLSTFLSQLGSEIGSNFDPTGRSGTNNMPMPPPPPPPPFAPTPPPFPFPPPPPGAGARGGRGRHHGRHHGHHHGPHGRRHGFHGARAQGSFPFFGANMCNSGRCNPMSAFADITAPFIQIMSAISSTFTTASADTRRAACNLQSAARGINPGVCRNLVMNVTPIIVAWFSTLPGAGQDQNEGQDSNQDEGARETQSDVLPESAISWLVTAVDEEVRYTGTGRLADAVAQFLRTALTDPAVVRAIRSIPLETVRQVGSMVAMGQMGNLDSFTRFFQQRTDDNNVTSNEAALKRFETHIGVACDSCGSSPIVGTRYKAMNRDNYDLCAKCVDEGKVNVEEEGLELKKCQYVWSLELGDDVKVPQAPLMRGDSNARVALLQKALTDAGFMKPFMYMRSVGKYGPRTENAVRELQTKFRLTDITQLGVYDAVTSASLLSILDSGAPANAQTGDRPQPQAESHSEAGPSNSVPETQA